eukprot:4435134-Amphidinium_carterae.1
MAGVQQRRGLFLNDVVWWKRLLAPSAGVQSAGESEVVTELAPVAVVTSVLGSDHQLKGLYPDIEPYSLGA